jgi:hypothetical protein
MMTMPVTPTDGREVLGAVAAGDADGTSDADSDAEGEVGGLPPALVDGLSPTQLVTIITPAVRNTALVSSAPNADMPEKRFMSPSGAQPAPMTKQAGSGVEAMAPDQCAVSAPPRHRTEIQSWHCRTVPVRGT